MASVDTVVAVPTPVGVTVHVDPICWVGPASCTWGGSHARGARLALCMRLWAPLAACCRGFRVSARRRAGVRLPCAVSVCPGPHGAGRGASSVPLSPAGGCGEVVRPEAGGPSSARLLHFLPPPLVPASRPRVTGLSPRPWHGSNSPAQMRLFKADGRLPSRQGSGRSPGTLSQTDPPPADVRACRAHVRSHPGPGPPSVHTPVPSPVLQCCSGPLRRVQVSSPEATLSPWWAGSDGLTFPRRCCWRKPGTCCPTGWTPRGAAR